MKYPKQWIAVPRDDGFTWPHFVVGHDKKLDGSHDYTWGYKDEDVARWPTKDIAEMELLKDGWRKWWFKIVREP